MVLNVGTEEVSMGTRGTRLTAGKGQGEGQGEGSAWHVSLPAEIAYKDNITQLSAKTAIVIDAIVDASASVAWRSPSLTTLSRPP